MMNRLYCRCVAKNKIVYNPSSRRGCVCVDSIRTFFVFQDGLKAFECLLRS